MTPRLHVLMVSLDDGLLLDRATARGDVQDRMLRYAEGLASLTCVVYARRVKGFAARQLAPNLRALPTNSLTRALLPFDAWRLAARVVRRTRADVVTTQDPFTTGLVGLALRRAHEVPLNVQVFTSFLENPYWSASGPGHRLLHHLGRAVLKRADTVRVESAIERERVLRLGVPADRVWVIPLLVNVARFTTADGARMRGRLLRTDEDRLVLYVGRLAPEKDLETLLRAVPMLVAKRPGTRVAIVGDGPEEPRFRRLAATLGVEPHITFTGRVAYDDLPSYVAACDVFVLPSRYEGIPTVLIEAALCAKPVVTTRTPNVTDVMEEGTTGFTVPQGCRDLLAHRVLELLEDPELASAMGRRGRELVMARYDPERIYRDLLAMWEATAALRR